MVQLGQEVPNYLSNSKTNIRRSGTGTQTAGLAFGGNPYAPTATVRYNRRI
jgi:hypothetical protein